MVSRIGCLLPSILRHKLLDPSLPLLRNRLKPFSSILVSVVRTEGGAFEESLLKRGYINLLLQLNLYNAAVKCFTCKRCQKRNPLEKFHRKSTRTRKQEARLWCLSKLKQTPFKFRHSMRLTFLPILLICSHEQTQIFVNEISPTPRTTRNFISMLQKHDACNNLFICSLNLIK